MDTFDEDVRATLAVPGRATELLTPFVLEARLARIQDVLSRRTRRLCALIEHVHDPHNVAACIRSADASGLQDIHVVPAEGDGLEFSREVTQGCDRWITLHYHRSTADAVAAVHAAGYVIGATDLRSEPPPRPLAQVPVDAPLCVAFGNESVGITEELRRLADFRIAIPMLGFSESLNISVAFAVTFRHLRERLDALGAEAWRLDEQDAARLLDSWMIADLPQGDRVLATLVARGLRACPR